MDEIKGHNVKFAKTKRPRWLYGLMGVLLLLTAGFLLPEDKTGPVTGASRGDWHPDSFWYEPWGASGVHKGVDVFAKAGVPVVASTHQWVIYRSELPRGGKVVMALGPRWRIHYYAHLQRINETRPWVAAGTVLGAVGDTGNARGKQPHLHYAVVSLVPTPWKIDGASRGYLKAFYQDPAEYLQ